MAFKAMDKGLKDLVYCECGQYLWCNFSPLFGVLMQEGRERGFINFIPISGSICTFLDGF